MDTTKDPACIQAQSPITRKGRSDGTSSLDDAINELRSLYESRCGRAFIAAEKDEVSPSSDSESKNVLEEIASFFILCDEDEQASSQHTVKEDGILTAYDGFNCVSIVDLCPTDGLNSQIESVLSPVSPHLQWRGIINNQLVFVCREEGSTEDVLEVIADTISSQERFRQRIAEHALAITVASPDGISYYDVTAPRRSPFKKDPFPVSRLPMAELERLGDKYGKDATRAIFGSFFSLACASRSSLESAGVTNTDEIAVRLLKDDMRRGGQGTNYCDPLMFCDTVLDAILSCRPSDCEHVRKIVGEWLHGTADDIDSCWDFKQKMAAKEGADERAERLILELETATSALLAPLSDIAFLFPAEGGSAASLVADGFTSRKCDVISSRLRKLSSVIERALSQAQNASGEVSAWEAQKRDERKFFNKEDADISGAASFMTEEQRKLAGDIFDEYNSYRVSAGLAPCKWSDECADMAYAGARGCARAKRLDHRIGIPEDKQRTFSDVLQFSTWKMDAGEPVRRWAQSAGHSAQMMCPSAEDAAVAVYEGNDGTWYYALVYDFKKVNQGHVGEDGKVVAGAPATKPRKGQRRKR